MIEGEALLKRGQARDAVAKLEDGKRLADSWLLRFDRGRAYLDLGAFTEAEADFENCAKRRGEATALFLDDVPTFHYFLPVLYYLGRAQEGLHSANATDSYKQFLAIAEPPLVDTVLESTLQGRVAAAEILGIHRATLRKKLT